MVTHWDEVEPVPIEGVQLRGTRWKLGAAGGARRAGCSRYRLGSGERAMPVHVHVDDEEIVFVLAGAGLSWQDGRTYEVRAGDTLVHRAGAEAHALVAGDDGLDYLAFSAGSPTGMTWVPRAGAWWIGPSWLPADRPSPFAAEEAAGPLDVPDPETSRPPTIVALEDVEVRERHRGDVALQSRDLGRTAGSVDSGVRHLVLEPGGLSAPPHCHSAEEEIFVVLDGDGVVLLGDEEHAVRPGSVVVRPPATGAAHAFRGGANGLTLLAWGNREANDMAWYPRSSKVYLRGLKAMFRVERVDYWEGEE